jgi:hypothetical protein
MSLTFGVSTTTTTLMSSYAPTASSTVNSGFFLFM